MIPTRDLFLADNSVWTFQQDNAPCQKAKTVTAWFEENNIRVLQWPARRQDLNPIENVWSSLDRKLTNATATSLESLGESLKDSFDALSIEYCQKTILFN